MFRPFVSLKKVNQSKTIALIAVYNDRNNLQELLKNIDTVVDGAIVLDDGSDDDSGNIARESRIVLKVIRQEKYDTTDYNVGKNLNKLISAGKKYGPGWFLVIDPDERFEKNARTKINKAIKSNKKFYGFPLRELWESRDRYRSDGIWGQKVQWRLIKNEKAQIYKFTKHHNFYFPVSAIKELDKNPEIIDCNLYHLKMITEHERVKRREKFERLDPTNKYQSIGYSYLTDPKDIKLTKITTNRSFE